MFLYIIHFAICVLLVLIILMQDGKAGGLVSVADSSKAVFGAKGAGDFLSKVTTYLAIFFMITSLTLTIINASDSKSVAADHVPEDNPATQIEPVDPNAANQRTLDEVPEEMQGMMIELPDGTKRPIRADDLIMETVPFEDAPPEMQEQHREDLKQREAKRKEAEEAAKQKQQEQKDN